MSQKNFESELIIKAATGGKVSLEIGTKESQGAFNRRPRHIYQIAEALPFIKANHLAELL